MFIRSCFILMLIVGFKYASAQSAEALVQKANALYGQNKKQEAKVLYEKAALLNNADAHFNLAYRYALSGEDRLCHYQQAALRGHSEAMASFLDEAFFRPDDFFKSDPFLALTVYKKGKSINPAMQFYGEAGKVKILQYVTEAGRFDANAFVKKYQIDTGKLQRPYSVWEIAEEASRRKGRFADVDNKLLLQLVSRGGGAPAELMIAIDTTYKAWKENLRFEFNICNYITSGYGMGYCARRSAEASEVQINNRLTKLASAIGGGSGKSLKPAYKAASDFLEAKVWNEELHGGSGYAAWATESLVKQKKEFIELLEGLSKGKLPKGAASSKNSDARLNLVYKDVIGKLKKAPLTDFNAEVTADGLQKVQRLWIPYRDATVTLLFAMNPDVTKQQWVNWMTEQRIKELTAVLQLKQ